LNPSFPAVGRLCSMMLYNDWHLSRQCETQRPYGKRKNESIEVNDNRFVLTQALLAQDSNLLIDASGNLPRSKRVAIFRNDMVGYAFPLKFLILAVALENRYTYTRIGQTLRPSKQAVVVTQHGTKVRKTMKVIVINYDDVNGNLPSSRLSGMNHLVQYFAIFLGLHGR